MMSSSVCSTPQSVAVVQMVSGADVAENLRRTEALVAQAVDQGARLVLLPENFAVFNTSQLIAMGEAERTSDGPIRRFLAELARRYGIWLVAGSLPILAQGATRVRAACLVLDDEGQEVARYDKIHLFDVEVADKQAAYQESAQIEPGDQPVVVDTPVGRLGLSICYDLRFAELYRHLVDAGAQVLTVPAAFTRVTGEAHWEALLRARAIESQCYILAANQGGVHNERRETSGDSMLLDPWGRILGRHPRGEGVVVAEVDLAYLEEVRVKMPIQQHRRL